MVLSQKHFLRIVNAIIGCPYKDGGRFISEGFDCLGVILYVFRQLDIPFPDLNFDIMQGLYNVKEDKFFVEKEFLSTLSFTQFTVLTPQMCVVQPLDILGMITNRHAHAMLVVDSGHLVHSNSTDNKKVVIRDIASYKEKSLWCLRYKGLQWTV